LQINKVPSTTQISQAMKLLQMALKSGNLSSVQSAFATLQGALKGSHGPASGAGRGTQNTASPASSSPSSPAPPAGSKLNIVV